MCMCMCPSPVDVLIVAEQRPSRDFDHHHYRSIAGKERFGLLIETSGKCKVEEEKKMSKRWAASVVRKAIEPNPL